MPQRAVRRARVTSGCDRSLLFSACQRAEGAGAGAGAVSRATRGPRRGLPLLRGGGCCWGLSRTGGRFPEAGRWSHARWCCASQEERQWLDIRWVQVSEPLTEPERLAAETGAPWCSLQGLQGEELPEVQGLQVPPAEATQAPRPQLVPLPEPLPGPGRQFWKIQEEESLLQRSATGAFAVVRAHGPSLRAGPPWTQQTPEVRCGPEGGPSTLGCTPRRDRPAVQLFVNGC